MGSGEKRRKEIEVEEVNKEDEEKIEKEKRMNDEEEVEEMRKKEKRRERLKRETERASRRGVCYLSRIPPHMDHIKLRHILSQHADVLRIYLAPEDPATRVHRKKAGGFRGQGFSEGWVEFADKREAKRLANMLNGEQIGGKKRSQFYFDLWNIKYLSKFKWDDLTEEMAYKSATREQKLALELSAAKRERDFYLSKVDKSRALTSIEERLAKKRKAHGPMDIQESKPKVFRQFQQVKPFSDDRANPKQLSKDILASVFVGS